MPKYSDYREYEAWVEDTIEKNRELRKGGLPTEKIPRGYDKEDRRYTDFLKERGWDDS